MKTDPILASHTYTEKGEVYRLTVEGGLHMIQGNGKPYFSLTASQDRKAKNGRWVEDSGGCMHETILRFFPKFKDLAALHLSDIDGVPMHALENGWYWFKGGCDILGEWKAAETRDGRSCLDVFAEHLRVSKAEAVRLKTTGIKTKADLSRYIEECRPRWKEEAAACILNHGLIVYGDAYNPQAVKS